VSQSLKDFFEINEHPTKVWARKLVAWSMCAVEHCSVEKWRTCPRSDVCQAGTVV